MLALPEFLASAVRGLLATSSVPSFSTISRARFRIGVARQPETESANPDEEAPN